MIQMPSHLRDADLALGPISMPHFEAFAVFCASPHSAFMGGPGDRRDAWESCATHAGQWALRGYGTYWLDLDGLPVGRVGVWHPVWLDEPELSWVIYEGFTGRGLAARAAARVRDAWSAAGGSALMSLIDPANIASEGVARSLGATVEGEHRYASGKLVARWRHRSPEGVA